MMQCCFLMPKSHDNLIISFQLTLWKTFEGGDFTIVIGDAMSVSNVTCSYLQEETVKYVQY